MPRKLKDHDEPSNQDVLWRIELPLAIEADWHPKWGPLLLGFPLELVYCEGDREAQYVFDPSTFVEEAAKREMHYLPRLSSDCYVIVTRDKAPQQWRTEKLQGEDWSRMLQAAPSRRR